MNFFKTLPVWVGSKAVRDTEWLNENQPVVWLTPKGHITPEWHLGNSWIPSEGFGSVGCYRSNQCDGVQH